MPDIFGIKPQDVCLPLLGEFVAGLFAAVRVFVQGPDHPVVIGGTDRQAGFEEVDVTLYLGTEGFVLCAVAVAGLRIPGIAVSGGIQFLLDVAQERQAGRHPVPGKGGVSGVVHQHVVRCAVFGLDPVGHLVDKDLLLVVYARSIVGCRRDRIDELGFDGLKVRGLPHHPVRDSLAVFPPEDLGSAAGDPLFSMRVDVVRDVQLRSQVPQMCPVGICLALHFSELAEQLPFIGFGIRPHPAHDAGLFGGFDRFKGVYVINVDIGPIHQLALSIREDTLNVRRHFVQVISQPVEHAAAAFHHHLFGDRRILTMERNERIQGILHALNIFVVAVNTTDAVV